MSLTLYVFEAFPDKKYVKKISILREMKPLKFEICKEMIGKCKFQMAFNHLKIDLFEIFLGVR